MKNKSFTLIELLVVIVIIGILAGVIIVSTSSSISKANIAKVKVFENSIQNELGANMVSRWKLDEVIGTTTTPDAWGSNTGTLGDGVTDSTYPTVKSESECVTGKCMSFDGGDYIDCGNDSSLNITDEISISLWIKANNTETITDRRIIYKDRWHSPYSIWLREISNLLYFTGGTDSSNVFTESSTIERNKWYYVTGVAKSGNFARLYMNGELKSDHNTSVIIRSDNTPLKISYLFNGFIDDVRIYNAAISSAQIKQNYIAGLNSLLANNNISNEEYLSRIENLSLND